MQFDIDPDLLPPDAVARQTYTRVIISRGAVALVDMDVEAHRSQLVQIKDRFGRPLPVGTRLIAQPSAREYTVAFDGIFDFNALSEDDYLVIAGEPDPACRIKLLERMDPDSFEMPELTLACARSSLASGDEGHFHSTGVPSL
jgi:outer membrane usher protein FimD/PapC